MKKPEDIKRIIRYEDAQWNQTLKTIQDLCLTQDTANVTVIGRTSLNRQITESRRLTRFLRRNLKTITVNAPDQPVVFLFFNAEGILLEISGNPALQKDLRRDGIRTGSRWQAEKTGPNAVTMGLKYDTSSISVGNDNYWPALQNYALYFMPVHLWAYQYSKDMCYGGIAIITPKEKQSEDHLLTLSAIAHDLTMTLHFNQTANMLYEKTGQGLMIVDTAMSPGESLITYCNPLLFEILGLPADTDVNFKPVETLIEPEPLNADFWTILKDFIAINETKISLNTGGKKHSVILSAVSYNQPAIEARGMIFYIMTPQKISSRISEKVGNSAIRTFDNVIGESDVIKSCIYRGRLLAQSESNVMLMGESGVGKDVFAQAIHNESSRFDKPFIAVNCGSLPRDLISSELFGYAPGAFTGARRQGNIGKFELANGGTIFLDEIGELPFDLQATLLRVVEQKQVTRLGSSDAIDIDVKIISATNADLNEMIRQRRFRSDLFFRLSTLQLHIPSLRERGSDIILLAEYFIDKISQRIGRTQPPVLSEEAKASMLNMPWNGNVRELQNLMECLVQLYPGPVIEYSDVLENLSPSFLTPELAVPVPVIPATQGTGRKNNSLTRDIILEALAHCNYNRSEAARYLGVARKTLYRNMERFGINPKKEN